MENASKALLTAAAVLIVILLVTFGIRLLNSTGETTDQVQQVGDSISSASKDAVDRITQGEGNTEINQKIYSISFGELSGCFLVAGNPNSIKENETVSLTFEQNTGTSMVDWSFSVSGADYSYSFDNYNLKIILTNPTSDINIKVGAEGCCFVPGTQVLLADGTTKNIEEVKVGDKVLSYNEEKQKYEENKVVRLITNTNTTNIARVNLIHGTSIEMNEYHPIYTKEGWKSLTNYNGFPTLTEDDEILSVNGKYIEISSIERWIEETPITTYNLSVANNHNYFVGETAILVHNAGCK